MLRSNSSDHFALTINLGVHGVHDGASGLSVASLTIRTSRGGYVTVTPNLHFLVSAKIRAEFENGRDYYRLNGAAIRLPERAGDWPMEEALRWHNEERFLG